MPHAVMRTDVYEGYTIPAGAGVFNCVSRSQLHPVASKSHRSKVWTINNDSDKFENPRVFNPQRFEASDTVMDAFSITSNHQKRPHFTFGAGRRICPGSHVAERTLLTTMARLIWAFEFDFHYNDDGTRVPIEQDSFTEGLVVAPQPFQYVLR